MRLKDSPKNEHLAEKRSFEGNCEILSTNSQPRALSSNIPASQEGVYLFYNPPINFFNVFHRGKRKNLLRVIITAQFSSNKCKSIGFRISVTIKTLDLGRSLFRLICTTLTNRTTDIKLDGVYWLIPVPSSDFVPRDVFCPISAGGN